MTPNLQQIWRLVARRGSREAPAPAAPAAAGPRAGVTATVDIAPDDPLVAYFLHTPGVVEVDHLNLDSPALRALRAAGIRLALPLVSQGELIGVLNLGPRLSEQEYSADDRTLLNNLAIQAAPALRVAQLVRQQQAEIRARERIEQELHVARLIQHTLLPKELPTLPGWQLSAYYQPARAVGGDFYDFLYFPDGRVGLVIGDVTDKGVPAALVMAMTRSTLRAAAAAGAPPGEVLARTNDTLCPDMPPKMFVTCLYAILDPATGLLQYANAGHDLPFRRHDGEAAELNARGMPLGLMPGSRYEQKATTLLPGDRVLFYSDGLVEAHNPERAMFGFPHLQELMATYSGEGDKLIGFLLASLAQFTGPAWEQEDDVTLMTLERSGGLGLTTVATATPGAVDGAAEVPWRVRAEWAVPSEPGNERLVMEQVTALVGDLGLSPKRLARLQTAVAEATMNAMEHGNHYQPDHPVGVQVLTGPEMLAVRITDHGGGRPIPEVPVPNLEAKLAEQQSPRGWGLFLIKNLVDEMQTTSDATHHTVELRMHLAPPPEGAPDGRPSA